MGWDTYPLIISSRIQFCGDFLGNFTEELMDGRYEGHFYRPLLNFTFALDYALWGLVPVGYLFTNAVLFAACAGVVYLLIRRAAGPGAFIAPFAALLVFLLHASQYEVLPVPARRPELLCGLFMALSLICQLSPQSLARRRPPILPAVFALLAIASKETALILPVLTFLAVLLYSPKPSVGSRLRHALVALVPHAVVLAGMVGVRWAVLGGLGGHASTQVSATFRQFPDYAPRLLSLLMFPQPVMQTAATAPWLAAALAAGMILTGLLACVAQRRGEYATAPRAVDPDATAHGAVAPRALGRTLVLALAWLILVGLTYAAAGKMQPWYLPLPVMGLALLAGAVADGLVVAVRQRWVPLRVAAVPTLLLLSALIVWQGRYSPLIHHYDEWERASDASRVFLDQLRLDIEKTAGGTVLRAASVPTWVEPSKNRPCLRGAAILSDYSVQAWAELTFPQRHIRVRYAKQAAGERPGPHEVLVLLPGERRVPSLIPGANERRAIPR